MYKDNLMRRALWVNVVTNLGGGLLFAFPSSTLGQLAGLPVYLSHRTAYLLRAPRAIRCSLRRRLRLARPPTEHKPAARCIRCNRQGRSLCCRLRLLGMAQGRGVLPATGDLVLAGIFAWWLLDVQHV